MWLATTLLTAPALINLPMPRPGIAVSLAITVRSRLPCRTSSSISRWGVPTPMKPPTINDAPSGISATASASGIVFIASCSGATACNVWRAIISSSLVGITQTATGLAAVLMRGPPERLAAASSSMPSQAASRQTRSRISGACSPMPAVNTSASMPCAAAASEPSSRPMR